MDRLLVTGGAGFVGTHVRREAEARGFSVRGVDSRDAHRAGCEALDLLHGEDVRRFVTEFAPDAVVHLAGMLRADNPRDLFEVNVVGTVNLLEALATLASPPRVLIASSSAVYGDPGSDTPIDEKRVARPLTAYGASKLAQEAAALRYRHARILPVVVARAFNIVGPGQPAALAMGAFARQIAQAECVGGGEIHVGSLGAVRDFVDVRDVARAHLALIERDVDPTIFNVCSETGVTMRRSLDLLIAKARCPIRVTTDEQRRQSQDVAVQIGDAALLRATTGWRVQIGLEESISDLLDDCRRKCDEQSGGM